MLKRNYKAWIISITLHVLLLLLFIQHGKVVKLPSVVERPKVINAYVSVDLTALPSVKKTQEKPSPEQPQIMPDEAKAVPQKEGIPKNGSEQVKDAKALESLVSEQRQVSTENSKTAAIPFKKLNPYAPIPQLNFENSATSASAFGQVEAAHNNSSVGRVTVPAQLTVSDKATVVWQSGDGSKRTEMLNGQCYDIDLNSVFGKSGVPSGSPRPCEDKEAKLFKQIMNKWGKK